MRVILSQSVTITLKCPRLLMPTQNTMPDTAFPDQLDPSILETEDSTDDRVSDVMAQLDDSEFTVEEYRSLAETILLSLAFAYQNLINDQSSRDEIEFFSSMATTFQLAHSIIAMEDGIEEDEDDEEDDEG